MPRSLVQKFGTTAFGAIVTVAVALGLSGSATAQTPAFTFAGSPETTGSGGNYVFGNSFTVIGSSILVDQLGYAAPGGVTGQTGTGFFSENHTVGIYDSTGTLLTSVVLTAGAGTNATTVISGFRYANLSSAITLAAGQSYVVAGTTGTVDPYAGYATAVTDPNITNGGGRIANSATLVNPQTSFEPQGGTAGPNFLIAGTVSSAPEPGVLALLATGGIPMLGLALGRRRRSH